MPTNEERREVARKLREISEHSASYFALAGVVGTCEPDAMPGTWDSTIRRLADLIEPEPERTCKPVSTWDDDNLIPYLACSECGEPLNYRENNGDYELLPYCAGCRAKVIQ